MARSIPRIDQTLGAEMGDLSTEQWGDSNSSGFLKQCFGGSGVLFTKLTLKKSSTPHAENVKNPGKIRVCSAKECFLWRQKKLRHLKSHWSQTIAETCDQKAHKYKIDGAELFNLVMKELDSWEWLDHPNPKAYIRRVTSCRAIDLWRKQQRVHETAPDLMEQTVVDQTSVSITSPGLVARSTIAQISRSLRLAVDTTDWGRSKLKPYFLLAARLRMLRRLREASLYPPGSLTNAEKIVIWNPAENELRFSKAFRLGDAWTRVNEYFDSLGEEKRTQLLTDKDFIALVQDRWKIESNTWTQNVIRSFDRLSRSDPLIRDLFGDL